MRRKLALAALVLCCIAVPATASAVRCVAVFFRGFNAPVGTSGMDNLEAHLSAAFGGNPAHPFTTAVFNWTEQPAAFAFIDSFNDIDCLVLAGHSFGANAAVELVLNFLTPNGIPVDLLVQFDSVGANDDVLPPGVAVGFNYHQISTGLFEPQGESNVIGATNVYVEMDYGVTDSQITHTEIDCPLFERTPGDYLALFGTQPDLYERVEAHVLQYCFSNAIPALGAPARVTLALALLALARLRRGPAFERKPRRR